jgi:hypothetical protein
MSKSRGGALGNSVDDNKSHRHEFETNDGCGFVNNDQDEDRKIIAFNLMAIMLKRFKRETVREKHHSEDYQQLKGDCSSHSNHPSSEEVSHSILKSDSLEFCWILVQI